MSSFIISCGGTGGHLTPGIALAEGLIERGHKCTVIVSNKQVDSRLIGNYPDIEFTVVPGIGFSLKPMQLLKFIYELLCGIFFAISFIRKKKSDIVVGFGGFTTLSVALAGFFLGCPVVLHEANRHVGKAIRLLSMLARRVYLPPGVQLKNLPPKTIRHYGYPLRKSIRRISKQAACKKLKLSPHSKRLLVIGGSQGASQLNQWVLDHFEQLASEGINIYCVTGFGKMSEGKLEYASGNGEIVQAIFKPFVDNMAEVLCCADLVVSRAGAGSIAEFSRCALPSILIPYPWATENHQEANAFFSERQGGGIVLDQKEMSKLYNEVRCLIFNDWLLDKIQKNLKNSEAYDSLDLIVEDLEALCL